MAALIPHSLITYRPPILRANTEEQLALNWHLSVTSMPRMCFEGPVSKILCVCWVVKITNVVVKSLFNFASKALSRKKKSRINVATN